MNVEELSARAEIHDVLLRYRRGLNRVDMKLVRGAFHDDAWVAGPNVAHVETYLSADHQGADKHHRKGDYVRLWARYLDRFEQRDGPIPACVPSLALAVRR